MALRNVLGDVALEATQVQILGEINSTFSRILEKRFKDTEEVRYDIPLVNQEVNLLINGSIYIGVAPDGTPVASELWTIVRVYFNGVALPERARVRQNVRWDQRTLGWT